jgi:hypothetical protein
LAVRLVDFLVAKSGCDAVRPATVAAILERPGKWEVLRTLAKKKLIGCEKLEK